jgi:hypothetical protein
VDSIQFSSIHFNISLLPFLVQVKRWKIILFNALFKEHAMPACTRTHQILEETQYLSLNILMPSLDRSKHSFNIDTAVGTKDLA